MFFPFCKWVNFLKVKWQSQYFNTGLSDATLLTYNRAWQLNERVSIWCLWPCPDKWCSMKNKCQVAEVALVDLYLTFGMGDGSTDRKGEAASFLLSQASGPLMLLLLISHVGSNLCPSWQMLSCQSSRSALESSAWHLLSRCLLNMLSEWQESGGKAALASPPHIVCH